MDTASSKTQQTNSDKYLKTILRLIVPLIPLIVNILFIGYKYNTHIFDVDLYWNDEVINWQQAKAFSLYGFDTGYYAPDENVAPASFTPFYVHGPWYPIVYGTVGSVVGWHFYSPVIFNTTLLILALYIFVFAMRLDTKQLLVLGGVLLVSYPIHLYINTSMQETINQAVAVLIAIIFYRLLTARDKVSLGEIILYGVFLFCMTVMRLSWGILLLPFFLLINAHTVQSRIVAFFQFMATSVGAYLIVQQVTPTSGHSVFARLGEIGESPFRTIQLLILGFLYNVTKYYNFLEKNILDSLQSSIVTLLMIALLLIVMSLLEARKQMTVVPTWLQKFSLDASVFHLYNLVTIHLASFALYLIATWGDYRVIFTHLLVTLLIMVLRRNFAPVIIFIVINVLALPIFLQNSDVRVFTSEKFPSEANTPRFIELATALDEAIVYDSDTDNRWCNTLLISLDYTDIMAYVPAGIGLSPIITETLAERPIQSQYLWVNDTDRTMLLNQEPPASLTLLFEAEGGYVMLNEDAECD